MNNELTQILAAHAERAIAATERAGNGTDDAWYAACVAAEAAATLQLGMQVGDLFTSGGSREWHQMRRNQGRHF